MTLTALVLLVPMLCATALAVASPFVSRRGGAAALGAMAATVVLAALVVARAGERIVVWFGGWHPRGGTAIGIALAPDRLGSGLALFVCVLALVSFVLAWRLIAVEHVLFDAVALMFVAAMVGFALTGDLFDLFVFFELMSVAAYVLVGYEVRRRAPLEGALTFAVTNSVGSILLVFGIGVLYGQAGALNLAQIGRVLAGHDADAAVVVSFALIAAGLLVKAAIVPFHLWIADAYAVAPTPLCILLAGAFSELGLFGLLRIYWTAYHPALAGHEETLRAVLVGMGSLSAVVGAVMCALQHHLKRMLAFATVAQSGMFLAGLGLLDVTGTAGVAVWVVADGLVKAALFACVAVVQHRADHLEERDLHGRGRTLPVVGGLFAACALAIASLPPTGSFAGRALVEDAALAHPGYAWLPALLAIVGAVVGGTLLRVAARVFGGWGERAPHDPEAEGADEPPADEREAAERTPAVLWVPAAVLVAAALAWGLVPGLADGAARAAAQFTDTRGYARAVLDGAGAELPAHAVHGPEATAYLYALASLAGAVAIAVAGLRGAGARTGPPFAFLRALHDGRPGGYVAWTATGTAVLTALLTLLIAR